MSKTMDRKVRNTSTSRDSRKGTPAPTPAPAPAPTESAEDKVKRIEAELAEAKRIAEAEAKAKAEADRKAKAAAAAKAAEDAKKARGKRPSLRDTAEIGERAKDIMDILDGDLPDNAKAIAIDTLAPAGVSPFKWAITEVVSSTEYSIEDTKWAIEEIEAIFDASDLDDDSAPAPAPSKGKGTARTSSPASEPDPEPEPAKPAKPAPKVKARRFVPCTDGKALPSVGSMPWHADGVAEGYIYQDGRGLKYLASDILQATTYGHNVKAVKVLYIDGELSLVLTRNEDLEALDLDYEGFLEEYGMI